MVPCWEEESPWSPANRCAWDERRGLTSWFREDSHISGVHFAIELEDNGCLLRDLNSTERHAVERSEETTACCRTATPSSPGRPPSGCTMDADRGVAPAGGGRPG